MHRVTLTLAAVLVLFLLAVSSAAPTWAGESAKKAEQKSEMKCTASTQECLNKMTEMLKTTGWVGIEMETDETLGKYRLNKVIPGSPAEAAGLKPGDILFAMYGIEFSDANSEKLKAARKDWAPGQEVSYTIMRGGQDKEIKLTLAPMPADVMAQWIGRHMMEHAQLANVAEVNP
jgi:C-terminal processing protease CtpA/Prc